jgi:hypothetical protein
MCECKNVRKAATGCLQTHIPYTSFINFYNTNKSKPPILSEKERRRRRRRRRDSIYKNHHL